MVEAANISSMLASLEQQYIEHKEKFEKWRIDNIKQCGTDTYNQYVLQFQRWEVSVKEQQRRLMDELNSVAYTNTNELNRILESLLSRLSFDDFLLVVVMMAKEDHSFFPTLLSAYKNSNTIGDSNQGAFYQQYVTPGPLTAGTILPAYQQPYMPTAQHIAPNYYIPGRPTEHVEATASNKLLNRPFDSLAIGGANDAKSKLYQPTFPVKDYRNPSTLPYRDFSQT